MRIFFASAENGQHLELLRELGVKNILMSYYYVKVKNLDNYLDKDDNFDIFIDSGGYSARKKGVEIDVDNYADFLKLNKDKIFVAANLDVNDLKISNNNQAILEQVFPKTLPVYHYQEFENKETRGILEEMCKKYNYIALGGMAGTSLGNKLDNFLNYCFSIIIKYKTKVHGFGLTTSNLLIKYPFYSVDSTSWLAGGQYGMLMNWIPSELRLSQTSHYSSKNKMIKMNCGISIMEDYKERLKHNIREFLKAEKDITKLWERRGIDFSKW